MPLTPGFFLHRSNRTEQLLEALADVVREPASADPLAPECIVVQGQGMGRWLSMSLAEQLGVWARPEFPVMRELLERCADHIVGFDSPRSLFDPDTLTFALADELANRTGDARFGSVASYLEDDEGGRRLTQLSERLAGIFDAYATQRPDWLAAWAAGQPATGLELEVETADWQAELWRSMVSRSDARSHDARMIETMQTLASAGSWPEALPERVSVFGLSSISPLHTHVLAAIAEQVPVHVFLLTPTDGWWADLMSLREQWRTARKGGAPVAASADERAALEGHPLLAAFGRLGRDFQQSFESHVDYLEPGGDLFVDPLDGVATPTLLRRLQARMWRWGEDVAAGSALPSPETDTSLRVHVCHSPQREIEVLHDQLLDLFERDPTLEPSDIVVMSPDIERHAPLVDAVFATRATAAGRTQIPYRIADRSIVITREAVAAFLRLLDAVSGRFSAAPLLDLLATPSIADRYGLAPDGLARIDQWVRRAGIRWGLDGAQRASEGLPDDDLNTWRHGLDRLLLGVAMDPPDGDPVFGRLPMEGVEGDDARLVGALAHFIEDLAWARAEAGREKSAESWARFFRELTHRFIVEHEDNAHHHQALREAFESLALRASDAGFERELGLFAVRSLLMRSLRASTPSHGFLSGGVTFCEMVPMRSIPFRVVCMLGLDDGAFPRIRRAAGFDLMARRPRLGDRSTRDDDRSLFLEALLSARDHLILSYAGRDVRDGDVRPPSVVVSELVDSVRDELDVAADDELAGWIVEHPLKAFDARYFDAAGDDLAGLVSYDAAGLRAARALSATREAAPAFVAPGDRFEREEPLPERLEIRELIRFLRHTSRDLLRDGLGLRVDSLEAPERDREPAGLDPLFRWKVGDAVLTGLEQGIGHERLRARLRSAGDLPPGNLGDQWFDDISLEAGRLLQAKEEVAGPAPLASLDVDVEVGGLRLVGCLEGIAGDVRVRCGFAKLGGTSELDAWVEHLAILAMQGGEPAFSTVFIGRLDGATTRVRFHPVPDAKERLEELVEIWRQGQHEPAPFFPRASRVYATQFDKAGDDADLEYVEGQASKNAYREYRGGEAGYDSDRSEIEREADVRYVWRGRDPLEPRADDERGDGQRAPGDGDAPMAFRALAMKIYGPMLAARGDES